MTAEQRALLAALRALPGVASADLEDDGHPGGAGALRLRLAPGADEVTVAAAVNRVLRTRFGLVVDVDRVHVLDDETLDLPAHEEPAPEERSGARWLGLAGADEPEPDGSRPAALDSAEHDTSGLDTTGLDTSGLDASDLDSMAADPGDQSAADAAPEAVLPARDPATLASVRALRPARPVRPVLAEQVAPPARGEPAQSPAERLGASDLPRPDTSLRGLRLALERVQLRTEGLVSSAAVTLGLEGSSWTGHGEAAATPTAVQRAVAVATARAVEGAIGGVARLEVEHVDVPVAGRERTALVVVSVVTGAGAERLSGASVVRQDVRQAVVRATLAAVNRRVEGWLPAGRAAG